MNRVINRFKNIDLSIFKRPEVYISLIIFALLILVIIVNISHGSIDKEFLKDQTVDNLKFTNAQLNNSNGISTFSVNIESLNESKEVDSVDINFKTSDGKSINLIGYIGGVVEIDDQKFITASIDEELTDISTLTYTINY